MNVNFEFLDSEAIENVITCLNYKVDKVVFFGYAETIQEKRKGLVKFLKNRCGVAQIEFNPISHTDLDSVIKLMKREIEQEYANGNQCYFDVTGGEGLALLAFGILSKEMDVPMHMYDICKGKLWEYGDKTRAISANVPSHEVLWNIETFVEMQGGIVDYKRGKAHKVTHTAEDLADIERIWEMRKAYQDDWNEFSTILAKVFKNIEGLTYTGSVADVNKVIDMQTGYGREHHRKSYELFAEMLDACLEREFLTESVHSQKGYVIVFKNEFVKNCLCEAGCALEQKVFLEERSKDGVIDCGTGIHIDWDGEIIGAPGDDVLNEIDVIVLKGYIPTFISCKAGKTANLKQDVLYELDAVTDRFGGKYAKKELAIVGAWSEGHLNRAKEMNIEVKVIK